MLDVCNAKSADVMYIQLLFNNTTFVFPEYFLNTFSNLSIQFHVGICNTVHVAVTNITK